LSDIFLGVPLLLVIDLVSTTVLFALACEDRQAETWGAMLELVQEQGPSIIGFVKDMARTEVLSRLVAFRPTPMTG